MAKPTIIATISLDNSTALISLKKSNSYTAKEESSSSITTTLTTSSTLVAVGTVKTPRYFGFSNEGKKGSLGTVLIGFDNVNFDMECTPQNVETIRLRNTDRIEVSTVTTIADSSGNLNVKYLTLEGNSGTWGIWMDIDNSGSSEPAMGTANSAKVFSIITDADKAAVALAWFNDLTADSAFSEDFTIAYDVEADDDFLTITDNFTGVRTNIADTGSTSFTVATTVEGAVGRDVYAKASVGEIECSIAIMPN